MSLTEPQQLQCDTSGEARQAFFGAQGSLGTIQAAIVGPDSLIVRGDKDALVIDGVGLGSPVTSEILQAAGFSNGYLGSRSACAVALYPGNVNRLTVTKKPNCIGVDVAYTKPQPPAS